MSDRTVGSHAHELLQKSPETQDPIELERVMQKDYMDNLIQCVQNARKYLPSDFFVVVITKRESLMNNVLRNYFFSRSACPTPDYDQSVYKFNARDERIEYLWTIPSKDACHHIRDNALIIHESEHQLRDFVVDFSSGALYKLSKRLNGECEDSSLLAT